MLAPALLGGRVGVDAGVAVVAHVHQAVADPVNVLLDAHHHVHQRRRAARPGDGEHVGEAGNRQAEVGARAVTPSVLQRQAADAAHVDLQQGAGERVVAGGEDDVVERVVRARCLDAGAGDALNGVGLDVDQRDVVAVEGLEVAGIDADALGAQRVAVRREQLGHLRILDGLADPLAHEVGHRVVGLLVDHQVVERVHEIHAAFVPAALVLGAALGLGHLQRAAVGELIERADLARPPAVFGVARLPFALRLVAEWAVAAGDAEVGRALEHREVQRLLRHRRHGLDARRAGADHADAPAGEGDRLMRPLAGVEPAALERRQALQVGQQRRRQPAAGHHQVARDDRLATLGGERPAVGLLVEDGAQNLAVEADVAAQVEAVGHMLQVAQDFTGRSVALAPAPLLLEFLRERERILQAFDIAARAGVAVPEPHATHIGGGLAGMHTQAQPAQAVDGVETGKAGTDDGDVELGSGNGSSGVHRVGRASTVVG